MKYSFWFEQLNFISHLVVTLLKYCWYSVKHKTINQSILFCVKWMKMTSTNWINLFSLDSESTFFFIRLIVRWALYSVEFWTSAWSQNRQNAGIKDGLMINYTLRFLHLFYMLTLTKNPSKSQRIYKKKYQEWFKQSSCQKPIYFKCKRSPASINK